MVATQSTSWVVYEAVNADPPTAKAVCTQYEWDEISARWPLSFRLVHVGLRSEPEADKLTRGTAGDPVEGKRRQAPRLQVK